MNILFVSNYYPSSDRPQFCIFIQQQAQALISLGHNVEVIVPFNTYRLNEKIVKKEVSDVSVYYSEYFTLYKQIFSYLALRRNVSIFEQFFDFTQYDVISIHMFDEFTLRIFTWIAQKYKVKLVIHFHGLSILYDYPIPLLVRVLQHRGNHVLKSLIGKADAVVGVSDKVCERAKYYLSNDRVYTVYNGVNTSLFTPSAQKYDNYTIVSVASFKKIKGNHYLIKAVKLLTDTYSDETIRLYLVGYGPEEESLNALVKELNMENIVRMIGYIEYKEVANIVRQCDVFVMPSYYEALGCAYLEAMACKIPVIGCWNQGIDEIIIDGINGMLVQPHNVEQIFEKLNFLKQYPEKAAQIALNGYYTVTKQYTWADSAKRLARVYSEL